MNAAVAVADQWFTLDRDWVIADCGDGVPGIIAKSVGMNLWDAFPGAREKFQAVYEAGWDNGKSSGVVYWNEIFTCVETLCRNGHLFVSFQFMLASGLESAIVEALAALRDREPSQGSYAEPRLRLVRSG